MQNTRDLLSRISSEFDFDVPPDIQDRIDRFAGTSSPPPPSPSSPASLLPSWKLKMGATEFDLRHAAVQFYNDHAGTIQSVYQAVRPHLKGPMMPAAIIVAALLVSALASLILSVIQLAVLAVAVAYLSPAAFAALVPPATASGRDARGSRSNRSAARQPQHTRTPLAMLAGILLASYAVSSVAAVVVLASSAYAFATTQAKGAARRDPLSSSSSRRSSQQQRQDQHEPYSRGYQDQDHQEAYHPPEVPGLYAYDEEQPVRRGLFRRTSRRRESY